LAGSARLPLIVVLRTGSLRRRPCEWPVFAGAVYYFGRFLYSQQASSDVRSEDLLGQTGHVVVTIPAGGVGQVRCRLGEELVDKIARANDGQSIAENTSVRVEQVVGELIVVKRS
jgi:membrane protein implicated in regulation of membrane protease activity